MAQDYTTTGLLADIKRRGMLPSTSETLSTQDFLAIATGEMQTHIMALLLSVREEYAVVDFDQAIVAGQNSYPLPYRGVAEKMRLVSTLSSAGTFMPLPRTEPERAYEQAYATGGAASFYLKDDNVVLVPTPAASGTLRISAFRRPNKLVQVAETGTIATVPGTTSFTTAGALPATFQAGTFIDIVDSSPGFRTLAQDIKILSVVGTTVTLAAGYTLPSTVAATDYVCIAGDSPVPQIPVELHPLLAQLTVCRCLETLAPQKAPIAQKVADTLQRSIITLLAPRTEGEARYLINRNGPGFGNGRTGRFGRRWS